jgi:hypothetical protein
MSQEELTFEALCEKSLIPLTNKYKDYGDRFGLTYDQVKQEVRVLIWEVACLHTKQVDVLWPACTLLTVKSPSLPKRIRDAGNMERGGDSAVQPEQDGDKYSMRDENSAGFDESLLPRRGADGEVVELLKDLEREFPAVLAKLKSMERISVSESIRAMLLGAIKRNGYDHKPRELRVMEELSALEKNQCTIICVPSAIKLDYREFRKYCLGGQKNGMKAWLIFKR